MAKSAKKPTVKEPESSNNSGGKIFITIAAFAFIGLLLLAASRAGSNGVSVFFESRGSSSVVNKIDGAANGGTFIEFQQRNNSGGDAIIERSSLPVRNTVFDTQQYADLPAAQIPIGTSNSFVTTGAFPFGFMNSEFGKRARGPFDGLSSFRTWCSYSHLSYDDPVVFPGQDNAAHLHMFFGNTITNENSTGDSLVNAGGSSCDGGPLNRTAYWTPAMMDGSGNVVVPRWLFIYYKTFDLTSAVAKPSLDQTEVFAEGLGFLSKGTGSAPDIDYWCGSVILNTSFNLHRKTIPDCNDRITQRVRFPFCWDGRLSSDDNSHMVMPIGTYEASICPDTHQRRIPHIEYQLEYTVPGSTANWHLSSDVDPVTNQKVHADGSTGHGDWFNGWNPTVNEIWNRDCTRDGLDCTQNVYDPNKRDFFKFHDKSRFNGAGSNIIPASEINKICPGDNDSGPFDGAHCTSALQANAAAAAGANSATVDPEDQEAALQDSIQSIQESYLRPIEDQQVPDICTEELLDGVCAPVFTNNEL